MKIYAKYAFLRRSLITSVNFPEAVVKGPVIKGPRIHDLHQSSGVFAVLIFGTNYLSHNQKRGVLKYLCIKNKCLIVGMGKREVEMLIYENILESEAHLIGLDGNKNQWSTELIEVAIHSFYENEVS